MIEHLVCAQTPVHNYFIGYGEQQRLKAADYTRLDCGQRFVVSGLMQENYSATRLILGLA